MIVFTQSFLWVLSRFLFGRHSMISFLHLWIVIYLHVLIFEPANSLHFSILLRETTESLAPSQMVLTQTQLRPWWDWAYHGPHVLSSSTNVPKKQQSVIHLQISQLWHAKDHGHSLDLWPFWPFFSDPSSLKALFGEVTFSSQRLKIWKSIKSSKASITVLAPQGVNFHGGYFSIFTPEDQAKLTCCFMENDRNGGETAKICVPDGVGRPRDVSI